MISVPSCPDDAEVRQTSRVATFTGVMMFWAAVFVPIYLAMGGVKCALVLLSGCGIALGILLCLRMRVSTRICGNLLCCGAFYVYTMLAIFCGGRWAPTTIWYLTMPVLAMAVGSTTEACVWSLAGLLANLAFTGLDYAGVVLPSELDKFHLDLMNSLGLAGLLICFHVLAYVMIRFERHARDVLWEANRWLQAQSTSDALTNVANRRCFDQAIEKEWKLHLQERLPLSVALLDLDFFKDFNDDGGHLAGDEVLRLIAGGIKAAVRRRDLVARFGGEEFVVILANTPRERVPDVTARILRKIDALDIQHPCSPVSKKVTISIGTTTIVPTAEHSPSELLREADEALYHAKAAGRNRVVHANPAGTPDEEGSEQTESPQSSAAASAWIPPLAAAEPAVTLDEAIG